MVWWWFGVLVRLVVWWFGEAGEASGVVFWWCFGEAGVLVVFWCFGEAGVLVWWCLGGVWVFW